MGFVTAQGSTWYTTEKRKTKINHTSKDGVHQFGGEMAQTLTYSWDLLIEGSARPLANWLLIREIGRAHV